MARRLVVVVVVVRTGQDRGRPRAHNRQRGRRIRAGHWQQSRAHTVFEGISVLGPSGEQEGERVRQSEPRQRQESGRGGGGGRGGRRRREDGGAREEDGCQEQEGQQGHDQEREHKHRGEGGEVSEELRMSRSLAGIDSSDLAGSGIVWADCRRMIRWD